MPNSPIDNCERMPIRRDGDPDTLERWRIRGAIKYRADVRDYLVAHGFVIKSNGYYTDKRMHPRVDTSGFVIVAERERAE